jgi:hypothetical protein
VTTNGRRRLSTALVAVATVAAIVAVLASWAQRTLFDSQEFADRATVTLRSSAVRRALADVLADRLIASGVADLASFRSVLVPLLEDVEETDAFHQLFRGAVVEVHRAVFQRHADEALLELGDTLSILTSTAKATNDSVASKLPASATSLLVDASPALDHLRLWRIADDNRWLDEVGWVVAVLAAVGAVAVDRRRVAILKLGVGVVVVGAVVMVVTGVVPRLVARDVSDDTVADAVQSGVTRFMADLRSIGLWTIPVGVIIAAAATASGAPHLLQDARAAWRQMTAAATAGSPAVRVAVGVVLMAVAVVAVIYRDDVVPLLVVLAAALAGYLGAVVVFGALLGPVPEAADAAAPAHHRLGSLRTIGVATLVVALAVLVVVGGSVAVSRARDDARADTVMKCNGFAELCDRRLDQVVFAGSHNSMSAALDPGWLFAENLTGIPSQLDYGVRALLVKTHYGIPTGLSVGGADLVVTDKAAEIAYNEPAEVEELSPEAVARAQQLEATVPDDPKARGVYLCHVYCSLGATKFSTTLEKIKRFLDRDPNEVIILFIGDYVSPADTATEFEKEGLIDRVWTYDTKAPPPTLREMITARRNLLVLSEHAGGEPPWYTKGYGIFQDTPYTFAAPSDFSCAPNRGPANAPLFEINHFITNKKPPSVEEAKRVNSYDVLMGRVRQCMAERQLFPTIVAVNFFHEGDLLKVVDDLNRVPPSAR